MPKPNECPIDDGVCIELEYRAEIPESDAAQLEEALRVLSDEVIADSRVSAMWVGDIEGVGIDIRVRLSSNGHCELVAKRGAHHAADRIEETQALLPDQFLGTVRTLSLLPLPMKLTRRDNTRYRLAGGIEAALVRAGPITYLEIECLSSPSRLATDRARLDELCRGLNIQMILDESAFRELCNRLSHDVDVVIDPVQVSHVEVTRQIQRLLGDVFPRSS